MSGVNKVILIGNLGADPEVRWLPNGNCVANLRIATSEKWKDKQTGQQQERTEWHRVSLFNRLGEVAGQYLRKGSKVYVEGKLQTRKWQAQDGSDRYSTEIVANQMQMLDGAQQQHAPPQQQYQQPGGQPPAQPQQQPAPAQEPPQGDMSFEDDIPF